MQRLQVTEKGAVAGTTVEERRFSAA